MPKRSNGAANILLILFAVALSAFDGWMSILTVLVFNGDESTRMWMSIYLPAALWIPAVACWWLPKVGCTTYAAILASSILLCVNPFHQDHIGIAINRCSDDLRFALIGAVLLLINIFVPRETVSDPALR